MTGKFITTYDGFAGVTKTAVDINFSGFQTLPNGIINAKIACAALEGDLNLLGDQIYFKSEFAKEFSNISDVLRQKTNVFNSLISIDNKYFSERVPNSANTLGYDSFIMAIQNPNNSIIQNNTKEATVKFKSYGDRYFVFFNAFNVEVMPPAIVVPEEIVEPMELLTETNKKNVSEGIKGSTKIATVKQLKPIQEETPVSLIVENDNTKIENKVNKSLASNDSGTIKKKSTSVDKEYYSVAGVFKGHSNTTNLIAKLKSQGVDAFYVTNPKNNYRYVCINKSETYKETSKVYAVKLNGKHNKDIWTFGFKKQANSSVAENGSLDKDLVVNNKLVIKSGDNTPAKVDFNTTNDKKLISMPVSNSAKSSSTHNKEYYLVVGVFRIHANASNLEAKLKNKGVDAHSFVNPKNKFKYVYVSKNKSFKEASGLCKNKMNGTYNENIWIFGVSQQSNIVSSD